MTTKTRAKTVVATLCAAALAWAPGCTDGEDDTGTNPSDSGTQSDSTDKGTGTFNDETDTCGTEGCNSELPCIREVRGRIVFENGKPMKGPVPVCTPQCTVVQSDDFGHFVRSIGQVCKTFDFSVDEGIHVTVMYAGGQHAMYSGSFKPLASELEDGGVLDVGTLTLYALPSPVASYTAQAGAAIDAEGIRFTLPPESLVELNYSETSEEQRTPVATADIQVFRAPLDTWSPPFALEVEPDLLYFIGPYWGLLDGEVSFEIDAPAPWADGSDVAVYMLGEYLSEWGGISDYIYHGAGDVCTSDGKTDAYIPVGDLAQCGTATVQSGIVTTPPLPRLGWYGLKKL